MKIDAMINAVNAAICKARAENREHEIVVYVKVQYFDECMRKIHVYYSQTICGCPIYIVNTPPRVEKVHPPFRVVDLNNTRDPRELQA